MKKVNDVTNKRRGKTTSLTKSLLKTQKII